MLRYFVAATALVVAFIVIVTAFHRGAAGPPGRPHYVTATGTPGPPQNAPDVRRTPEAVTGFAPWALSALPECFTQTREVRGPAVYVRAHLGASLPEIPVGRELRSGDCSVVRRRARLEVKRGADVALIVPDVVGFSAERTGSRGAQARTLVLVIRSDAGLLLRRYRTRPDSVIVPCYRP